MRTPPLPLSRRGLAGVTLVAALSLAIKLGCAPTLDNDAACKDAAYVLASRSYDCNGDSEAANARADWLDERFGCLTGSFLLPGNQVVPEYDPNSPIFTYKCVERIKQLSCETVASDALLDVAVTQACEGTLSRRAGPLPDPDAGTDADADAGPKVCEPGSTRACYPGPAAARGVGACVEGTQTCDENGEAYSSCEGAVLPASFDTCAPGDDDCNGVDDCGYVIQPPLVTATATGLVWLQQTQLQGSWEQAKSLCESVQIGNGIGGGFRLPTRQEWATLVIAGKQLPFDDVAFPVSSFIGTQAWTADEVNASTVWARDVFAGSDLQTGKENSLDVRCVRSP